MNIVLFYIGKLAQLTEGKVESIFEYFGDDMAISLNDFKLEVTRWKHRWSLRESDRLPKTLLETLDETNVAFYPGIYVAIKTLLTYPVSACAAERSFSSMKRLKTPLRNTMTGDRLSSLAVLHIHKKKDIDVDDVITKFAQLKDRRLRRTL